MRYMLLIYGTESCWTEEEREACMVDSMAICEELAAQGKLETASPLHSVLTATSVRVRDGKRLITDGPFAETTEQLGGYYVLNVEDLDEAIAIASRLPPAKIGTVEIRPIFDVSSVADVPEREIISARTLPFSREEVFAAFADPARVVRWWGPDGFTTTIQQHDLRPGGTWKFVMHGPDGTDYDNEMVFESIVAPERVVIEHRSEPWFRMTMTLTPISEKATRLHWRQRFESREVCEEMKPICVPANEQNFNRLTVELSR